MSALLPEAEARLRSAALDPAEVAAIMASIVSVERYDAPLHAEACAHLALRVREYHGAYPLPRVEQTLPAVSAWLDEDDYLSRIVASHAGAIVGHVGLAPAHHYLTSRLPSGPSWAEVTRLFADPASRGLGIGALLLDNACAEAQRLGLTPALAVLDGSRTAIALYRRLGWTQVAVFDGSDGHNLVFRGPSRKRF